MIALIVDDEAKSRQLLGGLISDYCDSIQQVVQAEDVKTAVKLIQSIQPDLVFLDVEMPGEDGFELFKYFPRFSFDVIFVTAYDEYAVKAFEYAAVDYLLKPLNIQRLVTAVERVVHQKAKARPNHLPAKEVVRIALPTMKGLKIIDLQDILYCKAERNYTTVITIHQEKITVSRNIGRFEELLDRLPFFRIHRSSLINIEKVKLFLKGKAPRVVMANNDELEVSANKREDLLEKLNIL